ncbi:hypothetical protein EHW12_30280 (plasmid) [Rhodococcus sp. NJ-530]|nr:hypothetical protein EHW12_30280 [Rhodococcus sp. NJ-530]
MVESTSTSDRLHAFIDESKRGRYALCVATVAIGDLSSLRVGLNALRPQGHSRIHMSAVGNKYGPRIVSGVAKLEAVSRIYVMDSRKATDRQARDATLAAAVIDLAQMPVANVVIETCEQDRDDRRLIRSTLPDPPFEYRFDSPSNPLLWLPDVHAWAWGRGGSVKKAIASRITVIPVT